MVRVAATAGSLSGSPRPRISPSLSSTDRVACRSRFSVALRRSSTASSWEAKWYMVCSLRMSSSTPLTLDLLIVQSGRPLHAAPVHHLNQPAVPSGGLGVGLSHPVALRGRDQQIIGGAV